MTYTGIVAQRFGSRIPSHREFDRFFGDATNCDALVLRARFGARTSCRRCASSVKIIGRKVPRCLNCGLRVRSKTGTLLGFSKISFHRWFQAVWLSCMSCSSIDSAFLTNFQGGSRVSATMLLGRIREFKYQICKYGQIVNSRITPVKIGVFRMNRVSNRAKNGWRNSSILGFEQGNRVKLLHLNEKPSIQASRMIRAYLPRGSHLIVHAARKSWRLEDQGFKVTYSGASKPIFQGEDPLLLHLRMNVSRDIFATRPYIRHEQLQGYLSQWELWHNFRQNLGGLFTSLVRRSICPELITVSIYDGDEPEIF